MSTTPIVNNAVANPAIPVVTPVVVPDVTPTVTPVVTPEPATSTVKTLQQVLDERKAALQPKPAVVTPVVTPVVGEPLTPPIVAPIIPDPIKTSQEALFQLAQNDPQKLISILQAAQGEQPKEPEKPATLTPEQYHQQVYNEGMQHRQQRNPITAESILGDENAADMGLTGQDFSPGFEQFIYATIAPVLGNLMAQMNSINHNLTQQMGQYQPALESYAMTATQRELGRTLTEVFPLLATDKNAVAHAEKKYNELAPILMPPELLKNPQSNPKEYARITAAIAKIAASDYSNVPPVNNPVAPTIAPTATLTPEPQQLQPTYRNHMGQFATNAAPKTLDEFNRKRMETLFPRT